MLAAFPDQPEEEAEILERCDLRGEPFAGPEQMVQVGAGVLARGLYAAIGVYNGKIVFEFGVFDIQDAMGGIDQAVAGIACGEYTVKHIYAEGDGLEDVFGLADAHQIAGFVGRENGADQFGHGVHFFVGFADGKAADGIDVGLFGCDVFGGGLSQVAVGAALHDGSQDLAVAVQGFGLLKAGEAAVQPAVGEFHGSPGIVVVAGPGRTLVEGHDDVGADAALDVHDGFRGKVVFGSINVGGEADSVFGDFAAVAEGIDLKSAAVGQDALVPADEAVESAGLMQNVRARAEIQVVGIAQDDLCAHLCFEFVKVYGLDAPDGTHGHEDRGLDDAVTGHQLAGAGGGLGIACLDGK